MGRDATFTLDVLAVGLGIAERWEDVAQTLGASDAHRSRTGITVHLAAEADLVVSAAASARRHLGSSAFDAAHQRGEEEGPAGLLTSVTVGPGARRPRPADGWSSLTPAEQRVADLVAAGLTNKEIAAELVVSVETVKTHVSHVFRKVGLRSRTALATQHPGGTAAPAR